DKLGAVAVDRDVKCAEASCFFASADDWITDHRPCRGVERAALEIFTEVDVRRRTAAISEKVVSVGGKRSAPVGMRDAARVLCHACLPRCHDLADRGLGPRGL